MINFRHITLASNFYTTKFSANRQNTEYTIGNRTDRIVQGTPTVLYDEVVFCKELKIIYTHGAFYEANPAQFDLDGFVTKGELIDNYVNKTSLDDYYTKLQTNNFFVKKSDLENNYYNKDDTFDLFVTRNRLITDYYNKSDIEEYYYTKRQTNNLLEQKQDIISGEGVISVENNVVKADLSNYYNKSEINSSLDQKQDIISGEGVISVENNIVKADLSDYYDKSEINTKLTNYYTESEVNDKFSNLATVASTGSYNDLEDKPEFQNLTAGENIEITNGVISAIDTKYTAGEGIEIDEGNKISLIPIQHGFIPQLEELPEMYEIDGVVQYIGPDTETYKNSYFYKFIEIQGEGEIAYTWEQTNVQSEPDLGNYYTSSIIDDLLATKQDTLISGNAIEIDNDTNTISVKYDSETIVLDENGKLKSSVTAPEWIEIDDDTTSTNPNNPVQNNVNTSSLASKVTNLGGVANVLALTENEYNALETKNSNTLYIIIDD